MPAREQSQIVNIQLGSVQLESRQGASMFCNMIQCQHFQEYITHCWRLEGQNIFYILLPRINSKEVSCLCFNASNSAFTQEARCDGTVATASFTFLVRVFSLSHSTFSTLNATNQGPSVKMDEWHKPSALGFGGLPILIAQLLQHQMGQTPLHGVTISHCFVRKWITFFF